MAKSSDPVDQEPVDAEFEPALDDGTYTPAGKTSGLTGSVLAALVVATLAGGALGIAGSRMLAAPIAATDDAGLSQELAAQTAVITGLETRLAALESEDPAQTARMAVTGPVEDLNARLGALEAVPPGSTDLTGIEARLLTLESAETELAEPADTAELEDLRTQIAALRTSDIAQTARLQQVELDAGQASGGVDPQILENLSERILALETAPASTPETAIDHGPALAALQTRIAELEAELAQTRSIADTAQTTASSAADRPADTGNAARQLAARTLALTAMRDIAASGDAFEAERAALARLWRGNSDVAALASWSRAGVPTHQTLTDEFPGTAIRDAAGSGRIFFGLIEVRSVDPDENDTDPLAITEFAEQRLREGDLQGAVSMIERLQGEPLEAAQAWLLSASARSSVDMHIASLRQALVRDATAQGANPT
jgi:hypothetical protein